MCISTSMGEKEVGREDKIHLSLFQGVEEIPRSTPSLILLSLFASPKGERIYIFIYILSSAPSFARITLPVICLRHITLYSLLPHPHPPPPIYLYTQIPLTTSDKINWGRRVGVAFSNM